MRDHGEDCQGGPDSRSGLALALRPKDAARLLGIGERKLWDLTKSGAIPHVRIGRCVLYPMREVEAWLRAQIVQHTGGAVGRGVAGDQALSTGEPIGGVADGCDRTAHGATHRGAVRGARGLAEGGSAVIR